MGSVTSWGTDKQQPINVSLSHGYFSPSLSSAFPLSLIKTKNQNLKKREVYENLQFHLKAQKSLSCNYGMSWDSVALKEVSLFGASSGERGILKLGVGFSTLELCV